MLRKEAPQATPHDCGPSAAAKGKDTLTHACRTTSILQMHADTNECTWIHIRNPTIMGFSPRTCPWARYVHRHSLHRMWAAGLCAHRIQQTQERGATPRRRKVVSTASQPALTEPYYMRERKTHARREKGHRATQHSFPVRGAMSRLLPEPRNNMEGTSGFCTTDPLFDRCIGAVH